MTSVKSDTARQSLAELAQEVGLDILPLQEDGEYTASEWAKFYGVADQAIKIQLDAKVAAGQLTCRLVRSRTGHRATAYRKPDA